MPSPAGWHEVPCVECGAFVAGINFGERCRACYERRQRRASRLASQVAIAATVMMAAWVFWKTPNTGLGRWYGGLAIGSTYFLVRLITRRVAMEALR